MIPPSVFLILDGYLLRDPSLFSVCFSRLPLEAILSFRASLCPAGPRVLFVLTFILALIFIECSSLIVGRSFFFILTLALCIFFPAFLSSSFNSFRAFADFLVEQFENRSSASCYYSIAQFIILASFLCLSSLKVYTSFAYGFSFLSAPFFKDFFWRWGFSSCDTLFCSLLTYF
jgi:hypothetical protein